MRPLSVEDGVDPGEYDVCRKVKEWNPFEHGQSVEHKWYCADGPGLVLIQGIGGGPTESEVLDSSHSVIDSIVVHQKPRLGGVSSIRGQYFVRNRSSSFANVCLSR